MRYLLDESAPDEQAEKLSAELKCTESIVARGSSPGLLHLKAYYLKFIPAAGSGPAMQFFGFGSANATKAAFGGARNAEIVAISSLDEMRDAPLLDYVRETISAIEARGGDVESAVVRHGAHSELHLPSFRVLKPSPHPGFDSWLQRGRLVAKYRDAQHFMSASIGLKKPLPIGEAEKRFVDQDLVPVGDRKVVHFRYIASKEESADENTIQQWKARYCVGTHLGDWISEDCFKDMRHKLGSRSSTERLRRVGLLRSSAGDENWRATVGGKLVRRLSGVWDALRDIGYEPSDYLLGGRQLDEARYRELLDRKIIADYRVAQDESFRERYVNGFEFLLVPKFRADSEAWTSFVRSWCESVSIESAKRSTRSLVAATICKSLGSLDDLGPEYVEEGLRRWWTVSLPRDGDRVYADWEGEFYPGVVSEVRQNGPRTNYQIAFDDGDKATVNLGGIRGLSSQIAQYHV